MTSGDFESQRERLIEQELRDLGVRDEAVLTAMKAVPREEFVSDDLREFAYRNTPLPIESGQTISQPLIVAHMCEALELSPSDRVLEIGTGSGYAAAVLSRIAAEVFTIERHQDLAELALSRLQRLGYDNVHVLRADGTLGWPNESPFDAIIVSAGSPRVPPALREQLAPNGRLVIPIGESKESQTLVRIIRSADGTFASEELTAVRFVPLIGETGWRESASSAPQTSALPPRQKRKESADRVQQEDEPSS